jgi:hypothetical protein
MGWACVGIESDQPNPLCMSIERDQLFVFEGVSNLNDEVFTSTKEGVEKETDSR